MITPKQLIQKYLKDNEISNAWLARRLGTQPQYLWKKFNRKDIDSTLITEISKVCKHNFYEDLAVLFDAETKGIMPVEQILNEPEVKYIGASELIRKIVKEELKKQKHHENE